MKKVAILGPRGTFSEEASKKYNAELILCSDIEEIFDKVEEGDADLGIVPIENSLEGSVNQTLDLLLKRNLYIYDEIVLDIEHCLVSLEDRIENVKEIISHPHALAQCRRFIKKLGVKTRNFPSTAEAAKEIKEKNLRGVAAIAPRISAELYGLKILAKGIQDEKENKTRFIVISKNFHEKTGKDKTSIIIGLSDKPGALYEALGIFAKRNINLKKIESRPSKKALGDYIFYIDFEGHVDDNEVKEALNELKMKVPFLKILGSYPMAF